MTYGSASGWIFLEDIQLVNCTLLSSTMHHYRDSALRRGRRKITDEIMCHRNTVNITEKGESCTIYDSHIILALL